MTLNPERRANATPAALGYRMPAEWEPHAATWIAWPHKESDWPGKLSSIPWIYVEIVRWIAKGERCEILVRDAKQQHAARDILAKLFLYFFQLGFAVFEYIMQQTRLEANQVHLHVREQVRYRQWM